MLPITSITHPYLHCQAFTCSFSREIDTLPSPEWLQNLLKPDSREALLALADLAAQEMPALRIPDAPLQKAVRQVLRYGGFKPSGRSKPASEYLVRASAANELGSINPSVDVLNAVSLHSGLPISVIDATLATEPLSIRLGAEGESYVFNASGQEIALNGLLCLCDAQGPCANAVKDSQRTKTKAHTTETLSIIWGTSEFTQQTEAARAIYQALLRRLMQDFAGLELQILDIPIEAGKEA